MAEISVSMILDAITVALDKESPTANIYIDKVEQGLCDGDYIVRLLNTEYLRRGTGSLNRVVSAFDIIYLPKSGNRDCIDMGNTLSEVLSSIKLSTGDMVRATEKSFEIIDSILHFRISYPYDSIVYRNDDIMGRMILNKGE